MTKPFETDESKRLKQHMLDRSLTKLVRNYQRDEMTDGNISDVVYAYMVIHPELKEEEDEFE